MNYSERLDITIEQNNFAATPASVAQWIMIWGVFH